MENVEKSSTTEVFSSPDTAYEQYEDLRAEHETLRAEYEALSLKAEELDALVEWYKEQFRLKQAKKFGPSSEKTPDGEQISIFNEAEKAYRPDADEPTCEEITYTRSKARKATADKYADLPVEVIEYKLEGENANCEFCGEPMDVMSTEIREEIVIVQPSIKRVVHKQEVRVCKNPNCEDERGKPNIVMARAPEPVIPHSPASASLIAYIMNRKYAEAVPLDRQEKQFAYAGIDISKQNMANWVIKGAALLDHVYVRLHVHLMTEHFLHADETPMQVLSEPGKKATSKSYIWLYASGKYRRGIFLYEYQPSRSGKHPKEFLKDFNGILQVDGYDAYKAVQNVTIMACFTHARRGFVDALKSLPDGADVSRSLSATGRDYCNKLFALEREYEKLTIEQRYEARIEHSKPIVDEFHAWLLETDDKALPKSKLGSAVKYCLNQWSKLVTFLEDGEAELSNNRAERAIKPFVIGRKNWLFAKSQNGARASATVYSIIETAKANGLIPFEYLQYLLQTLPNIDVTDTTLVDKLMPWSESLPECVKMKQKAVA